MVNQPYLAVMLEELGDKEIVMPYDGYSTRCFIAGLIYAVLFLIGAILLFYFKFGFSGRPMTENKPDFLLACIVGVWGVLALINAFIFKPRKGDKVLVSKSGLFFKKKKKSIFLGIH